MASFNMTNNYNESKGFLCLTDKPHEELVQEGIPDDNLLAIVPYKPLVQSLTLLDQENVLAPIPISTHMPDDNNQALVVSSSSRPPRFSTVMVSISEPFGFTLPDMCVQFFLRVDQVTKFPIEGIRRTKQENWLDLPIRLEGWRIEKRQRQNGLIDWYYLHQTFKKLRSEPEVKFYVKYGFIPSRTSCKKRSSEENEAPSEPTTDQFHGTFLSKIEKTILYRFNNSDDIPRKVDEIIREKIKWIKNTPVPPPAGNATSRTEPKSNAEVGSSSSSHQHEEEQTPAARDEEVLEAANHEAAEIDDFFLQPITSGFNPVLFCI